MPLLALSCLVATAVRHYARRRRGKETVLAQNGSVTRRFSAKIK